MSSNTSPNGGRRLTIGVVDDDPAVLRMVADLLAGEGYETILCPDAAALMAVLASGRLDLIVLDLRLPDRDGISIAAQVRGTMDVPIIMLTGRGDDIDRIMGLEVGADDYIVKPFDARELVARIKVLARRQAPSRSNRVRCGNLVYDMDRLQFAIDDAPLVLTPREHAVLEALMLRARKTVSKATLAESVSAADAPTSEDAIEIYVSRLRKKLEASSATIITLRGLGYLLEDGAADE